MLTFNNYKNYINCIRYLNTTHKSHFTFVNNPENRKLLFSKAFSHDISNSQIIINNEESYNSFIDHLLSNNSMKLSAVDINSESIMKYVDVNIKYTMSFDIKCPFYFPFVIPPLIGTQLNKIEMCEVYFMSWLRDIPFSQYNNSIILDSYITKSINYLNDLSESAYITNYFYPEFPVSRNNLFRGRSNGDKIGPYVSQFLLYDSYLNYNTSIPSNNLFKNKMPVISDMSKRHYMYNTPDLSFSIEGTGRTDYGVTEMEYLKIANGEINKIDAPNAPFTTVMRHVLTGRDLASLAHADYPCEFYIKAVEFLLSKKVPLRVGVFTDTNMGKGIATFVQFSGPEVHNVMGQIAKESLRVVCFLKYHWMRMRPEELASKINSQDKLSDSEKKNGLLKDYFNNDTIINILNEVKQFNNDYNNNSSLLMPLVYPEGAPVHPSYPAGHAVIASACVSYIKAFFNTDLSFSVLAPPVDVSVAITGVPINYKTLSTTLINIDPLIANQMTIGGELDKLCSNIAFGRNFAGIHYRSDAEHSFKLGELICADFIKCKINDFGEQLSPISIKFIARDNKTCTITKDNIHFSD